MKRISAFLIISLLFAAWLSTCLAATEAEIEEAIENGLAWLVAQQETLGYWPGYYDDDVATTGLALLKLQHRAYELGYDSPFDTAYEYHEHVINGLNYLFDATATRLLLTDIGPQDHTAGATGTIDDPDHNSNGTGVYAHGHDYPFDVYDTGIVLSAVAASGTPTRVVNVPGSVVNGWTYMDVAQDMVDWLAWAQSDAHTDFGGGVFCGEGGWSYAALDNTGQGTMYYGPDNSNSGYAVLGLAYAQLLGCTVPAWVPTELNAYVGCIQDPVNGDANDGGSWYEHIADGIGVNMLKTGNLLFEMGMVGDTPTTQRVVDALDYLARHWGDASGPNQPPGWDGNPAQYQTMFTVMKGLEYMAITEFSGIDWFSEFADKIVSQQVPQTHPDPTIRGAWVSSSGRGTPIIITEWALLTLEKVSPPGILRINFDIKPTSCPNPLNTKSKGVLPAAILGTEDFDVSAVDPATLLLMGVPPIRWAYEDVAAPIPAGSESCFCHTYGPDGIMDLTLKFSSQAVTGALGTVYDRQVLPMVITGLTKDGIELEGYDCVIILHKQTPKYPIKSVTDVHLESAKPNPFRTGTEISFGLPQASHVSLAVYDVQGAKVKTLVDGLVESGMHVVHWDGTSDAGGTVPSGIYFYRMRTQGFDETLKVILAR